MMFYIRKIFHNNDYITLVYICIIKDWIGCGVEFNLSNPLNQPI